MVSFLFAGFTLFSSLGAEAIEHPFGQVGWMDTNPRSTAPLSTRWVKEDDDQELAWSLYVTINESIAPYPVLWVTLDLAYSLQHWPSYTQSPVYRVESDLFDQNSSLLAPTIDGNVFQVCSATDRRDFLPAAPRNLFYLEAGEHKVLTIFVSRSQQVKHAQAMGAPASFVPSDIFFLADVRFASLWQSYRSQRMVNHQDLHSVDTTDDFQETYEDYQHYWNILNQFSGPTAISLFRCNYDPVLSVAQDGWNHYQHLRELGRRINAGVEIADVDGNGYVDFFDMTFVANSLGQNLLQDNNTVNPEFNWKADLNGDQTINYFDLVIAINQVGRDYR
jgi:hypothetical protein